ncbi:S8 family serine peptidase [candidate division WOR-3 bacterium]|nr:S8 family serine peptidase [candidate division WOR-3 bacterium]
MKRNVVAFLLLSVVALPLLAVQTHKPGEVVVKFINDYRGSISFDNENGTLVSGIESLDKILADNEFNDYEILVADYDFNRNKDYGLDMMYVFRSSSDKNAVASINDFNELPFVEFVELNIAADFYKTPNFTGWEPFYLPNDPYYTNQWFLNTIYAFQAWDLVVGNHSSIVGVVDDACERNHQDLQANYITGYDYVNNDNDPTPIDTSESHGTHCSGLAAAVTNNSLGIAGASHNVGLIGVRTYYLTQCAQGIYFCSQNGANVISMSWGPGSSGILAAINDAHDNYDVICLSSAGNDNVSTPTYPAAYDNCVAVASSGSGDFKSSFSNYGYWIDITSPGENMYSTIPYGAYGYMDGTSMSCPLAAGVAALIRVFDPSISADSTELILEAGCDAMFNDPYFNAGNMGAGRINVLRSIGKMGFTDFRFVGSEVSGPGGSFHILPGQQGTIEIELVCDTAYRSASSIQITASSSSPIIALTDSVSDVGSANPGDTVSNSSDPIVFNVSSSATVQFVDVDFVISSNPDPINSTFTIRFPAGGIPEILIVNADVHGNYSNKYSDPLERLSRMYDVWYRYEDGPVSSIIQDYQMIIWYSGDATVSDSVLSGQDIVDLTGYIDSGRDLFITGQNIAQFLNGNSFSTDYLHVAWIKNGTVSGLDAVSGSIFDPIMVATAGGQPSNQNSRDVVSATNGGNEALEYLGSSDVGAVTYFQGSGKVVFFGFGFEAIYQTGPFASPDTVMKRVLDWFETGVEEQPVIADPDINTLLLTVNGVSVFTSSVHFSADIPQDEEAGVYVFDITGRNVRTIASGLTYGSHRLTWDGRDEKGIQVSGGNYIVRMIGRKSSSSTRVLLVR